MRRVIRCLPLFFAAAGRCSPVSAQSDPFGVMDTVAIVASVEPIPETNQSRVRFDLWVYSDERLAASVVGFRWDNPAVQMDSAIASPLIQDSYDVLFFYEGDSLAHTNLNLRFLFAGLAFYSPGVLPDASGRRLWASYYFTAGWTGGPQVVFDTLTFSAGSEYVFIEYDTNEDLSPFWPGPAVVPLPLPDLAVWPAEVGVTASPGCPIPVTGAFAVCAPHGPLTCTMTKRRSWLKLHPYPEDTPFAVDSACTITVWIVPRYLAPGFYYDTITVSSSQAANSPEEVVVQLEMLDKSSDCCYLRGDADLSGDVAIGDVTMLVGCLFLGGPCGCCPSHCDIDGNGQVNALDVTGLIQYMFRHGRPPAPCD
ncbi:MAG: hypothetical protein QUV05_06055 [Phycisphaerae bacterium]|nr:hypothetical protein [Phycisphaerae bacterium]